MSPKRRRRDADAIAETLLSRGKLFSDADVLEVLSRWSFRPNGNRLNLFPVGAAFVHSDTFGLVRDRRGRIDVDRYTRDRPSLFRFLAEWIKQRRPIVFNMDFPFTSISVNFNYAARLHRDGNNAGVSLSRSFGDFTGGELTYWPNDDRRTPLELLRERDALVVDTRDNYTLFDGCRGHRVEPFTGGDRYSLVYFTISGWTKAPSDRLPTGAVCPTEESLKYFTELLAPPRGQGNSSILVAFGKTAKAQLLYWQRANLAQVSISVLRNVATYAEAEKSLAGVCRRFVILVPNKRPQASDRT